MNRRPWVGKNEDGFTLLEVLVAFVILAGSLGLIYNFLMSGAMRSEASSAQMKAILMAQSKMAESQTLPPQSEGDSNGFHWTVMRTPQNSNDQNARRKPLRLDTVKVTVTWQDNSRERSFQMESLRPSVE